MGVSQHGCGQHGSTRKEQRKKDGQPRSQHSECAARNVKPATPFGRGGHWKIVGKLNEKAGDSQLQGIVEWVTPIQQRHFDAALQGSLKLAAEEDPNAVES